LFLRVGEASSAAYTTPQSGTTPSHGGEPGCVFSLVKRTQPRQVLFALDKSSAMLLRLDLSNRCLTCRRTFSILLDKSSHIPFRLDYSIMRVDQTTPLSAKQLHEAQALGSAVARLRAARRVRQSEAALRAGMSRNTAYRLERGDPGIALGQVLRYVDAIAPGVSLVDVLGQRDPALKALEAREKTTRVRAMTGQEARELDF
jgi:DNA-binding XRE family transcriptional regulator